MNRYCMCKQEEELIDYILLHSVLESMLWQWVFSTFGIAWMIHSSTRVMLLSWKRSMLGRKGGEHGQLPVCVYFGQSRELN